MARRTFFSFHYERDVQRAHVVRNSWVTKPNRMEAGFFDSSVFEATKRTGDQALKRFLDGGLVNCSVTAVLIGNQTAWRRWVRYEILRSFVEGKGVLGIYINSLKNFYGTQDYPGPNPFELLGFEIHSQMLSFKELGRNGWEWVRSTDIPGMPLSDVRYNLRGMANATFAQIFSTYDWVHEDGYTNLGNWVEDAATTAGR